MATNHQVIDAHKANPFWTGTQIAAHLGCDSAYVRATATRNGIILPMKYDDTPAKLRALAAQHQRQATNLLARAARAERKLAELAAHG